MTPLPLVVGISGASGVIYGIRLLEILRDLAIPAHLVMSRSAEVTLAHETDLKVADVRALAAKTYAQGDIGASIAALAARGEESTSPTPVMPASVSTRTMSASWVPSDRAAMVGSER